MVHHRRTGYPNSHSHPGHGRKGRVNEGDIYDGGNANAGCVDARLFIAYLDITRKEENHPTEEKGLHDVEEAFL